MKVQKNKTLLFIAVTLAVWWASNISAADAQDFSEGKTLFQLRQSLLSESNAGTAFLRSSSIDLELPASAGPAGQPAISAVLLPRWNAEDLPVFCRIEHEIAKGSRIPLKFRLGSVEYVDWLEGKTRFPTFAPR